MQYYEHTKSSLEPKTVYRRSKDNTVLEFWAGDEWIRTVNFLHDLIPISEEMARRRVPAEEF